MGDKVTGSGGNWLKRRLTELLFHRKKHSRFRLLLLVCLVLLVFGYTRSPSSLSWWSSIPLREHYQSFFSRTNQVTLPPPYRIHPKLIQPPALPPTQPPTVPTTRPPAVPTTRPPAVPPTRPPAAPPTRPPAVPPTRPPAVPPTRPPAIPPTRPPAAPPTRPPAVPPTQPPAVPPTQRPAVPPTRQPAVPPTRQPAVPPSRPPAVPPTRPPAVPPTRPPTVPPTRPPTVPPTGTQFHQAYPGNYHFIMDNAEVCKNKTPFLVLMVPVAPKNVAARDAIRQTWGKDSVVQEKVVLTLFMLGLSGGADVEQQQEKLKQENLQHHDLIQSNFMDSYLNLTIKTMVIMDWLAKRCPAAAYAMKIDSDMFLNIDNLVIMLLKPGIPKLNYLTGMLMWNRPVVRSKNSKWYVSEELYPEPQYPTYTLGMGYVFSNDLPEKFVEASKSIKPFNIEDAYIGMCMKKLGLKPTSPPNPWQFKAYSSRYDRCEYSKIITYILGSAQQLVNYWTDLKRPEPPCSDHTP